MHKSFFPLFIISLVGVLVTSNAQHSSGVMQYSGLIAGISPLAVYHAILLRKRLLSPTEVDSVYYFGFLVTVVTLVSTAISIGLSTSAVELRWVLLQFGLGLVATGYALFARLHLLAKSTATADTDVVDATERLAKSVERVAGEFDKAGYQVAAFVEQTERRLSELEQRAQSKFSSAEAKFEQGLNEAAISFNEILARSAAQSLERSASVIEQTTARFSGAISSVMEEVGRVQTEAEAISFEKAAERISQFAIEMEQSVASISSKVSEAAGTSADAISDLTSASRKAMKLATDISSRLETIGKIEDLAATIESATDAMRSIASTCGEADAALSSLAAKAEAAERGIREEVIDPVSQGGLAAALVSAERTISAAADSASRVLDVIDASISPAANVASGLASRLEAAVASASLLESGASSLSRSMAALESSLRQSGDAISAVAMSSAESASLASEVPDAAARISTSIGTLTSETDNLIKTLRKAGSEIESAAVSASGALGSIQSRLAPLDDLASSARLVAEQMRVTATTATKAAPQSPSPLTTSISAAISSPQTTQPRGWSAQTEQEASRGDGAPP